jgi:hypothetical protein
MEKWKKVPGYEYEASTDGGIRACKTGCILRQHVQKKVNGRKSPYVGAGYYRVELGYGAGGKKFNVHRLVLEAFVGPRPPGKQCRHINGDSLDNRLENLAWGTSKEDRDDRLRTRPDYYLTPADIAFIWAHPEMTAREVAAIIGCGKSAVCNVWRS